MMNFVLQGKNIEEGVITFPIIKYLGFGLIAIIKSVQAEIRK